MMHRTTIWRPLAAALLLVLALAALRGAGTDRAGVALAALQDATPTTAATCEDIGTPVSATPATPAAGMDHGAMGHGDTGQMVEFDQMYIDMMIPHHGSIVALAEAALPRLTDGRLREIAQTVIATQQAEMEELRGYRQQFYGSPDPMPMDDTMMGMMGQMMPSVSVPMDAMMAQMDAATQVAQFCAAADPDLAFIDLTIPHHQSAIEASQDALTMAVHPEIRAFAQRVIDDQQREIAELTEIRTRLAGGATPAAAEPIRTLTTEEVAQIERGEGVGLALPAEANGVPGPRHALDLAAELGLAAGQTTQLQAVFDAMRAEAIEVGERYLAAQGALEADFRAGTIQTAELPGRVEEVSRLRGELATVHLQAHLATLEILTPEQVATYNRLRGHDH
jgi:uncharacterized protein (DUF305 family)